MTRGVSATLLVLASSGLYRRPKENPFTAPRESSGIRHRCSGLLCPYHWPRPNQAPVAERYACHRKSGCARSRLIGSARMNDFGPAPRTGNRLLDALPPAALARLQPGLERSELILAQ